MKLTATTGAVLIVSSGVALASAVTLFGSSALETTDTPAAFEAAELPVGPAQPSAAGSPASSSAPGSPAKTSRSPGALSTASAPSNPLDCAFGATERAAYAIGSRDAAELDQSAFGMAAGTSGQLMKIESAYQGKLDTLVLSADEDGAIVLAKLSEFQSTAVREDAMVERPFLVRIAQDCSIQGFAHDADLTAGYARVQQAIIHDLSFSVPRHAAGSFEGTDALGELTGQMEYSSRSGAHVLLKRIDGLTPWSHGIGTLHDVEHYTATIEPSRTGWFETFELEARYSGVGITSTRTLSARRLDELGSLEGASRELDDYAWTDLLSSVIPLDEHAPASKRDLDARAAIRDHEVSDVLDRVVARVDADGVGIQDTWPELQVYLEARPEMAQVVADRLVADAIPARATMASFIALGNTRTLEAKQALLGIVRAPSNTAFDRTRASFSLVGRPDVGEDFAQELAGLTAPLLTTKDREEHLLARHALLALGMMSGLNPDRKDIKAIAVATIRGVLADADHSTMASPAYGAFSNIGDHELLPMIASVIDHPDYSTREVAALATRRMDPTKSADFTRRWLEKEDDWRVKLTLYHNLELQTFEAQKMTSRPVLQLALADLKKGPAVLTRKALVRLLGRAMSEMEAGDPLRTKIERQFVSMIRFEIDHDTGLYGPLTDHLDPALIREGILAKGEAPADAVPFDASNPTRPGTSR